MTTDAGSGFDNQAASRDEVEEESRHLTGDDAGEAVGDEVGEAAEDSDEARERKQVEDQVNDAF